MTREIKFRVFDGVRFFTPIIDDSGKVYDGYRNYEDGIDSYPNIMQFTGLKDKKGKEIFEGDIVEIWFVSEKFRYEVKWSDVDAAFVLETVETSFLVSDVESDEIEVIGNIHYDPELLNG